VKEKLQHNQHEKARQFSVEENVMAKDFRSGADWVQATIQARLGPLSYLIETAGGQL